MNIKIYTILTSALLVTACSPTWSTGSVNQSDVQKSAKVAATNPADITVTEGDIKNRKYVSLGDISATVNKTTAFNKAPTKEDVNNALRQRAAKLGADAVILARYGEGGISLFSWGSLEGKGRAIKFKK
jgi:uncharacterized protein YbjQ (UPF0145 family)